MKRIILVLMLLQLSACISLPDVYLIDRHTVMESEASGEWPQLEQRFENEGISAGPENFSSKEIAGKRRQRAFTVLNGEFPHAQSSAASPEKHQEKSADKGVEKRVEMP